MNNKLSKEIEDFKVFIAQGDIDGMSKNIEAIHENWQELDDAMKDEVQKLESIFLSIINLKLEAV